MFLRAEGDSGFSSRDPSYTGDPEATIEYRLNNGQQDWYPASWSLPIGEIRRALDSISRENIGSRRLSSGMPISIALSENVRQTELREQRWRDETRHHTYAVAFQAEKLDAVSAPLG